MQVTQAPETQEELHEEMEALVRSAASNGIAVEGGYALRGTDGQPGWDMEIVRLAESQG